MNNDINDAVCNSCVAVTPSNTEDLANYAFIQVRGNAGNVKVLPAIGDTPITLAMEAKEMTWFRVRRVYAPDTTATTIVAMY